MLVLCDFDGTVTEQDVTDLIWDDHLDDNWREELFSAWTTSRMSMVEQMSLGYGRIRCSPEQLLEQIRGRIRLRSGFGELVRVAAEREWHLQVLSCGLDFYIKELLPPGIPYHCLIGEFDGGWRVTAPPDIGLGPGEDFKVHLLGKLRAEHAGHAVVYIGDGRSDLCACRKVDFVFAKGVLADCLVKESVPFVRYSTLQDVADFLSLIDPDRPSRIASCLHADTMVELTRILTARPLYVPRPMLGLVGLVAGGASALADRLVRTHSSLLWLAAGLAAFRRRKVMPAAEKPSWFQRLLQAAQLANSIWLAFRRWSG
jgi:2-hydroxy-3-keto-5-methylthiopentenyl-1-phosphate phosphatase